MKLIVSGGSVGGTLTVPGDKSISQRAAIIGALARGTTTIDGFLDAGDSAALLDTLTVLGIGIERAAAGTVGITGRGNEPWQDPDDPLDLGNSGTAFRLLTGVLAGRGVRAVMTGDASLRRRPMQRIIEPLARMGAVISGDGEFPPLRLDSAPLRGIAWSPPIASAQVKSCVLLAGLHAGGETCVTEPVATRDHTERLLRHFGVPVTMDDGHACVHRCDWDTIAGTHVTVPGDISAAAFFAVGAAITPGATIDLPGVGVNSRRTGFLRILTRMGAGIELMDRREAGGEPVADLRVHGGSLQGVRIDARQDVADAIDEFPALMIAAACAGGETTLTGAGELKFKESDRIASMAAVLEALGVRVEVYDDGLRIYGGAMRGGRVDAQGDHRVAMAAAIAGLRTDAPVEIHGAEAIATSFPGFMEIAGRAGMAIESMA